MDPMLVFNCSHMCSFTWEKAGCECLDLASAKGVSSPYTLLFSAPQSKEPGEENPAAAQTRLF